MKCFEYNKKNDFICKKKNCRYWLENKESNNCCLNFEKKEKITLEEIGKIFNVTRMRICQIEKNALNKIKDQIKKLL